MIVHNPPMCDQAFSKQTQTEFGFLQKYLLNKFLHNFHPKTSIIFYKSYIGDKNG